MPTAPKSYQPRPKQPRPERHWKSRNTDYRSWYQSRAWKDLRESIITRDCGLCQECLRQGRDTPLQIHASEDKPRAHVDHIRPHRGNQDLFYDPKNLQTLCETCHSRKTVSEDGGFGRVVKMKSNRWVVTGLPASGKSTWINERRKPGDFVWDVDEIASTVFQCREYPRPDGIAQALAAMLTVALKALDDINIPIYIIETNTMKAAELALKIGAQVQVIMCNEDDRQERLRQRLRDNQPLVADRPLTRNDTGGVGEISGR